MLSNMDGSMSRVDTIQKKYAELLHDMKRTERDHQKAKKRGDQLQKEKDSQRTELNKVTAMKDKLEKISRDFTKENKRLKVRIHHCSTCEEKYMLMCLRMTSTNSNRRNPEPERNSTNA